MDPHVLVPAGAPILEAAAWVGQACWSELALHDVLTGWLADEDDGAFASTLWTLRAGTAERAEAWHRRLPELREYPRDEFVGPSAKAEAVLDGLATLTGGGRGPQRLAAVDQALARLAQHYQDHLSVAVGPADGPTARTLRTALESVAQDRAALAVAS